MVFPYSVPAKGHEVVHAVIGLGYRGEDGRDSLYFLGFGDGLEAEVGWPGGIADRRLVSGWVVGRLVLDGGSGCEGAAYLLAVGSLESPSQGK